MTTIMNKIVIQLICPDQQGIIAQITSILYKCKINIYPLNNMLMIMKRNFILEF